MVPADLTLNIPTAMVFPYDSTPRTPRWNYKHRTRMNWLVVRTRWRHRNCTIHANVMARLWYVYVHGWSDGSITAREREG